jgi:hypothetical protein
MAINAAETFFFLETVSQATQFVKKQNAILVTGCGGT